jgi:hypothetical protein
VDETAGDIDLPSLNDLLETLKQAYDGTDRARTAGRKLRKLKQKNNTFAFYLAEFRRLRGELSWDDAAQRDQLEDDLSEKLKDALLTRPVSPP